MAVYTLFNAGYNQTPGGADFFATSISATGTPPADFNPAAISQVTYSFEVIFTAAGDADDGMAVEAGCQVSVGGQVLGQLPSEIINYEPASGTYPFSRIITTGINQSIPVGNWGSAVVEPVTTPWITWLSNMKNDGGTLRIQAMTVEVEYTPLGPPVASFTASATEVFVGNGVTLSDTSTNNPTAWQWAITPGTDGVEWSWGASPNGFQTIVYFSVPGVYQVTLQATNGAGSDVSDPTTITVETPPPQGVPTVVEVVHGTATAVFVPDGP